MNNDLTRMSVSRRSFLSGLGALGVVAGLGLTGCGSSHSGSGSASGSSDSASADGLVIPVSATVTTLNRDLESMAEGFLQLKGFATELYIVDGDDTRYYLAKSCKTDDGLTYTLELRDDLKWHDGEKITADDVVFTLDCNAETDNGAGYTNCVFVGDDPVTYEKVDDLTVKIALPSVSASYFEILGQLVLLPKHAFDGKTDIKSAKANLKDIGSGPYKLKEFKDGESLSLEAFDDYYEGAPSIKNLTFKVIGDASAQQVAYKNGEVNLLPVTTETVAKEYRDDKDNTLTSIPEGRVNYLAWNKYCDTWSNKDAVAAVFKALSAQEIVDTAYGESLAVVANSIFSNRTLFHSKGVKAYKQDVDEAKKLAESSGLAGKTIKLYFNADRSYMKETAQVIQQQLKAIDVTVDVQGVESNGFFDIVFTDQADYELYLNGYASAGDPDDVVVGMYDGTWGINVDTPQEILDLFNQGRATVDDQEREDIYAELQQKAHDANLVYPIAYPNYCFVAPSNLKGVDTYQTTPIFEDYTKIEFA